MTVVHKTVATQEVKDLEFVMSDETVDRYGDVIEVKGWDLKWFKKNPIALFGHSNGFPIGKWVDVREEDGKLKGKLVFADEGTSTRIDELRRLVDQGVLKAVSVGFIPKEAEAMDKENPYSGLRFKKQELVECSLVAVPANPAALMQQARSMGVSEDTIRLAFSEDARREAASTLGENAHVTKPGNITMKTLSDRIQEAEADLVKARDLLETQVGEGDDIEAATNEVANLQKQVSNLRRAEAVLAMKSTTANALVTTSNTPTGLVAAPAVLARKTVAPEPKAKDLVVRAAVVKTMSYLTGRDPDKILEERYGDNEATNVFVRTAVTGATTTTSGWASQLVETAIADFIESLRPVSVFPRLAAQGMSMNFGPGRSSIVIPSRASTPSISGSFVAETSPIPVRKLGLTSLTLSPHKMGVISVFSRELQQFSTPQIESLLRQEIEADTAITIDSLLLDNVASSSARPAGLTNGVTAITAAAQNVDPYKAILEDIAALMAPFDTANGGRNLVLIMNPAQSRQLSMTAGPDGTFGWWTNFLEGVTRIVSTTVPSGDIFLIDAADFVAANGDNAEFLVSQEAVLHMEDTTPLAIGTTGTPNTVAAPTASMFQTAQLALRMLMDISWGMRRAGMVQWIDDVNWTAASA